MRAPARHPCPICGRDAPPRGGAADNPSFPFCSPACKLVDLGRWLEGSYRIPGPPVESTLDVEGEGDGPSLGSRRSGGDRE
jgi:endogenous inhibitor of DNA gyrase (YacG/DUF329 family)